MKAPSKKTLSSGLHVLLWKENEWYITRCIEVEIASQGKTKKEALKNIEEALSLFFEDEKLPVPKILTGLELFSLPKTASYG